MHATQRLGFGVGTLAIAAVALAFALDFLPERNIPPQLSDFTPPYTCPAINAPRSCSTPIKAAVECVDLRTIDPRNRKRPPTSTELLNADKACELLPQWIEQDPRIKTVKEKDSNIKITYMFGPEENKFSGVVIFLENKNFSIIKNFNERLDRSSYFVEKSLLELEKRGYLP